MKAGMTCAGDGACGGHGGCAAVKAGWKCSGPAGKTRAMKTSADIDRLLRGVGEELKTVRRNLSPARFADRSMDHRPKDGRLPSGPKRSAGWTPPPPPKKEAPDPTLASLFPKTFDAAAIAAKHGLTVRLMRKGEILDRAPGYFDREKGEIVLNSGLVTNPKMREGIVKRARFRSGLRMIPEDHAGVWCFLHELGHSVRRRYLPARGSGVFSPLHWSEMVEIDFEDDKADEIAGKFYLSWDLGREFGGVKI